jgi:cytochrome P450
VGQHLARFEMHILYEELLDGLPDFRLDPDKAPHFSSGNVISVHTLPILWDVEPSKAA